MRILGIDPGFERLGIAILDKPKNGKEKVGLAIKRARLFNYLIASYAPSFASCEAKAFEKALVDE